MLNFNFKLFRTFFSRGNNISRLLGTFWALFQIALIAAKLRCQYL